jgi:hypothetical protein
MHGVHEGLRLEARQHDDRAAGEQRSHREPQGSGVIDRRHHEVDVPGMESPEVAFLAHERLGVLGREQTRPDALGPTGRPRREVHRAAAGPRIEISLRAVKQSSEGGGGVDDHRRLDVRDDRVALVVRQTGIERHRNDA